MQDIPQTPTPVGLGGGGGQTPSESCAALALVSTSDPGAPNGCAPLSADKVIPIKYLPGAPETVWCIAGPTFGYTNTTLTYQITNYDSRTAYTVAVTAGTVSRSDDIITLTTPTAQQTITLTVNSKQYSISVFTPYINTPSITSPTAGATSVIIPVTCTSSAFLVTGGSDTHVSSTWQISTSNTFSTITQQVVDSATDLTSTTFSNLAPNTVYYVRMRQQGQTLGYSSWSSTLSFTTKAVVVPASVTASLSGSDSVAGDDFGYVTSISADGNTVVVGAFAKLASTGAAYVFTRSNNAWTQTAKLTASDQATGNSFGIAVSISRDGNYIAVGAYGRSSSKGAVYIFLRSGNSWSQQAIVVPTDAAGSDMFGISCTLDGDGSTLLAGAYYKNGGRGAAYVFSRTGTTWTQKAKLLASDAAGNDYFGYAIDWSGDESIIAIGSYQDDDKGTNSGSVYIYTLSSGTYIQTAKLTASDGATGDNFGFSLTMDGSGTYLCVGARSKTSKKGKAYIFTNSGGTWTQTAMLSPSDLNTGDFFSITMSMSQDGYLLAISAYQSDGTYSNSGSAYIFTRTGSTWTQTSKYVANDPTKDAWFGSAIQLSEAPYVMAVGAYHKSSLKGGMYIFS